MITRSLTFGEIDLANEPRPCYLKDKCLLHLRGLVFGVAINGGRRRRALLVVDDRESRSGGLAWGVESEGLKGSRSLESQDGERILFNGRDEISTFLLGEGSTGASARGGVEGQVAIGDECEVKKAQGGGCLCRWE